MHRSSDRQREQFLLPGETPVQWFQPYTGWTDVYPTQEDAVLEQNAVDQFCTARYMAFNHPRNQWLPQNIYDTIWDPTRTNKPGTSDLVRCVFNTENRHWEVMPNAGDVNERYLTARGINGTLTGPLTAPFLVWLEGFNTASGGFSGGNGWSPNDDKSYLCTVDQIYYCVMETAIQRADDETVNTGLSTFGIDLVIQRGATYYFHAQLSSSIVSPPWQYLQAAGVTRYRYQDYLYQANAGFVEFREGDLLRFMGLAGTPGTTWDQIVLNYNLKFAMLPASPGLNDLRSSSQWGPTNIFSFVPGVAP
jgi:hypothetical protein